MRNISEQRLIKITFFFSLTIHLLFLGLPIKELFISDSPPQEKEIQVRIEIEKPSLLPKIDFLGEEKRLKEVVEEREPPELEAESQPAKPLFEEVKIEKPIKRSKSPSEYVKVIDPYEEEAMLRYQDMVKQKIESCRRYPNWAKKQGFQGTVYLTFIVLSDGQARNIRVVRPSGFDILDQEAVSTVRKAEPFPPIPRHLSRSELKMEVAVVFKLR